MDHKNDKLQYLLLAFSIIGLAAMLYLILSFSANVIPQNSCTITASPLNCGAVVTSQYSKIGGVDLYYYGLAFFIVTAVLSYLYIFVRKRSILLLKLLMLISGLATVLVAYLVYTELFVLHYICILCTTGHISILMILFVSIIEYRRIKSAH